MFRLSQNKTSFQKNPPKRRMVFKKVEPMFKINFDHIIFKIVEMEAMFETIIKEILVKNMEMDILFKTMNK